MNTRSSESSERERERDLTDELLEFLFTSSRVHRNDTQTCSEIAF